MKTERDLDVKIGKALDSLENIQRAKSSPFLYTRIIGRLQREDKSTWEKVSSFLARPLVAILVAFIVISANCVVLYEKSDSTQIIAHDTGENSIIDDYSLQIVSFYDPQNP